MLQGEANITRFTISNGQPVAKGTFTGLVDGVQQTATPITSPVALDD